MPQAMRSSQEIWHSTPRSFATAETAFNMGVGLCLIVAPEDEAAVTEALVALGEKPFRVGECVEGSGKVVYSDER